MTASLTGVGEESTAPQSKMAQAMGGMASGHGSKQPAETAEAIVVEKVEGGKTVADIFAGKNDLGDSNVKIRGQVVKVSNDIMGTNWLHVQDGTGEVGANDLTVTSSAIVKVGDTVVVEGKVTLDKDFGYGYKYDIIMEGAAVTVE